MLDKLFERLKLVKSTDSRSPIKAGVEETTLNYDFKNLWVYQNLLSQAAQQATTEQNQQETEWRLPLPYDIVFTIVHDYLKDDSRVLRSLFRSCICLSQLCGPLLHQTVSINTRLRDSPTNLERFAKFLGRHPQVIEQINTLRIVDDGFMFQGSRPITPEEESLCFVLTRPFPRLRRIELDLHVVWDLIPLPVQHAFHVVFALPTLQETRFESCRIRSDLLAHLSTISRLEMHGEVSAPTHVVDFGETRCGPEHLVLVDGSQTGYVTNNIFHEGISPLRLSSIRSLEYRPKSAHTTLLNDPLRRCAQTLTSLSVLVNGWGPSPASVDLASLRALKNLTLSCDSAQITAFVDNRAMGNFNFLTGTLSSCRKPSTLENVHFIIRTLRFDFAKDLPWRNLNILFQAGKSAEWPRLKKIKVKLVDKHPNGSRCSTQSRIEQEIKLMVPSVADLLEFELSYERHQFFGV